ncbi:hypothetical protein Tco_1456734 [Tanacetum coccineum]
MKSHVLSCHNTLIFWGCHVFQKDEKFLNKDKITKADLEGPTFKLLKNMVKNSVELEYNLKQCYLVMTVKIDWTNPEGDRFHTNLSKSLPLEGPPGRKTIPTRYFFNNDLEEDRQWFYKGSIGRTSAHDVYSSIKIISVQKIVVEKKYGYGYLKETVVKRANQMEYMSIEAEFPRLNQNDIEDLVGERQRTEGKPKLLDTTVGRVVPLLPVAPARASSDLEASVEKLFDEGGSGSHTERGDSVSGGHGVDIPQVSVTVEIVAEDAAPLQPKRQRKRKMVVSDAGEPSHPPKKLREGHGTSTGPSVAGKSKSALHRLLVRAVLNSKVGVVALPTLPFITSYVSVTPEREDGNQSDFMAGANLRTITAPPRFVISSDSSHHSGANIAEAEVDSFARPSVPLMTMMTTFTSTADPTTTTKERFVESFIFGGGSSFGAEHTVGGFSGLTGSDFIVGGIRTVVSPDTDLQNVYIPQWSVTNGSRLDDGRTCREMVDEFDPPKFFASIRGMEHDKLFMEFNVGAARQMSLSAEARDEEIKSLKAQLLVKEAEAAEAIHIRVEASKFEVVEKSLQDKIKSLKERNTALEKEKGVLDVRVADLAATVKFREQEAADSDAMVTTVKLQNGRLADQVRELETSSARLQEKVASYLWHELACVLCLNSPEYLSALGAAIKKGMQDGLDYFLPGITHGQELMVHVYHSPDPTVIGARALSLSLGVSHGRVQRIRENIANNRSALRDVFVSFSEPLSVVALEGMGDTFSVAPDTTTALSVTLVSASTIPPISMDDYEITHADGQGNAGADVDPFSNVDDAELIIS